VGSKVINHNVRNEQIVLSSMIQSPKHRRKFTKLLQERNFIGKKHKTIFTALKIIGERNMKFDEDTLDQIIGDEEYGGYKYIRKLKDLFGKNDNIEFHIKKLLEDSVRINLLEKRGTKFYEMLEDPRTEIEDLLKITSKINQELRSGRTLNKTKSGKQLNEIYMRDFTERRKKSIFVPTHLGDDFDSGLTEGLARKRVSIWAGRPSMGKTTVVANVINRLINNGKKVLAAPIEGGDVSFLDALLAMRTEITLDELIKFPHVMKKKRVCRVKRTMIEITNNKNLVLLDDPDTTLDEIGVILEEGNFDACFIDRFENLRDINSDRETLDRKLKQVQNMSKAIDVHIGLLSQIKRLGDSFTKKDKRPTLEQLKNAGAYEEIADLIFLIYRHKYYNPWVEEDIVEINAAKQRRGKQNHIGYIEFHGNISKLGEEREPENENTENEVF